MKRFFDLVLTAIVCLSPAFAVAQSPSNTINLQWFWSLSRADNLLCATAGCANAQYVSGYNFIQNEGSIYKTQVSGTVPMTLWWSAGRGDNMDCVTATCSNSATQAGYTYVDVEGYVYPTQQPGTVPLNLYWNAARADNSLCITTACVNAHVSSGYTFVRVEGYALPSSAQVATRGGSNLNYYHNTDNAHFNNYPLLNDYHLIDSTTGVSVRSETQTNLQAMYSNGQRRLGTNVWFCNGCVPTAGGDHIAVNTVPTVNGNGVTEYLPAQFKTNFRNYLDDVKAAGYESILVGLNPLGNQAPASMYFDTSTQSWYYACTRETQAQISSYEAQNWAIIKEVRDIVRASGVSYMLDLGGESMVSSNPPACAVAYLQYIWQAYSSAFGTSDTVGFSMTTISGNFPQAYAVYGNNPPPVWDFHLYCSSSSDCSNKAQEIDQGVAILNTFPVSYRSIPWLIGETDYNQSMGASQVMTEIDNHSIPFLYLLQWSGTVGNSSTTAVPLVFTSYINAGF